MYSALHYAFLSFHHYRGFLLPVLFVFTIQLAQPSYGHRLYLSGGDESSDKRKTATAFLSLHAGSYLTVKRRPVDCDIICIVDMLLVDKAIC